MNKLAQCCVVSLLMLLLSSCQSMPAIQGNLNSLDFSLDGTSYIVRAGETGESIAFRHRLTTEQLASINPGVNLSNLAPGTLINIRQPVQTSNRLVANSRTTDAEAGYDRIQGELVRSDTGYDQAIAYPTQTIRPEVIVDTPLSDPTLLGAEPDYARSLPPMRVGTYTESGYPVEEVLDENYQIPQGAQPTQNQMPQPASQWYWPTRGHLARTFDPSRPNRRGIDIVGEIGQDVYAAADGRVIFAGRDPSNVGQLIIIKHDGDLVSVYSHTKDLFVSVDDSVRAGDAIASLGPNPNDESMLRFEVRREGKSLNPMQMLPEV
ncbi:MAG: peptidoglycan DD-metalloendopeptidase family protein [Granulosicoccus sp.]|nr:peptidoglycan DD-metalloendopeptidase family protein [Granulosicoccus sp.]